MPTISTREAQGSAKPDKAEASYSNTPLNGNILLFSNRTYESMKCYYLVFKPLNRPYEIDPEWFKFKSLDRCRKLLKCSDYFLTREINATKVHINALVYSTRDMVNEFHEKTRLNKFFIHCEELKTKEHRDNVLNYITKESSTREFLKYRDYISHYSS